MGKVTEFYKDWRVATVICCWGGGNCKLMDINAGLYDVTCVLHPHTPAFIKLYCCRLVRQFMLRAGLFLYTWLFYCIVLSYCRGVSPLAEQSVCLVFVEIVVEYK